MNGKRAGFYNHGEAYHLMNYKCEKCGYEEVLWNSRDGVTPFIIGCSKCDGSMQHFDWETDVLNPLFRPPAGSRIFVNVTIEDFQKFRKEQIEKYWESGSCPMNKRWKNKEEALEDLLKCDEEAVKAGAPHIKTV